MEDGFNRKRRKRFVICKKCWRVRPQWNIGEGVSSFSPLSVSFQEMLLLVLFYISVSPNFCDRRIILASDITTEPKNQNWRLYVLLEVWERTLTSIHLLQLHSRIYHPSSLCSCDAVFSFSTSEGDVIKNKNMAEFYFYMHSKHTHTIIHLSNSSVTKSFHV